MISFSDSVAARSLRRLARGVYAHPRWFVYPQIGLAVAGTLYTAGWLKLDMQRGHLIGSNVPEQRLNVAYQKEFPRQDDLVVVVQSSSRESNRQFVERLAARVAPETNLFSGLFYKGDIATLAPRALLLPPVKDLEQMERKLRDYRPLLQQFEHATNLNSLFLLVNAQFRNAMFSPGTTSRSLVQSLPFLHRIISQATLILELPGTPPSPGVEELFAGAADPTEAGYVTFDQGTVFLLTVEPRREERTVPAIRELRRLITDVQFEVPGVNVGLTGQPALNYDEMREAQHDSILASIVALVLCSMIFIIAYGQVWRPFKAALCLLVGMGFSLGFATLTIGHLNILSITFAPMLIGLALDFGVHFISRYEEEMRNRRTETEAIERATALTGQGIVVGALTTAAAFLAMALTNFKGIREMGIISGCGILLCLIPMMTCLPLLLRHGRQNQRDHHIGPTGQRRLRLEVLWLRHPKLVVAGTLLLCAGAALEMRRVYFDYDLLNMQSQSLPSVVFEKLLIKATGVSALYSAVIADSAAQAHEYEARIKRLPDVAEVQSAVNYVTPNQGQKLALIRAIKSELAPIHFAPTDRRPVGLNSLSATLYDLAGYLSLAADSARQKDPALADELGSLASAITRFRKAMLSNQAQARRQLTRFQQVLLDDLHRTFRTIQTQDTSGPLTARELPPVLRNRFIGVTGKYLLQAYSLKDLWRHNDQRQFLQELKSVVPADRVAGTPSQLYEYTTLLKNSYEQAAGYALIAITLVVLLQSRSPLGVGLALLPVAIGGTWLLGLMGLAGIPFNPANIMTLPLVVGIGVTNGIQVLNRFAEEQEPSILAKSTGKAVLVSGLTAIAGFGSLMLARHQGIKSLGEVMSAGIAACVAAALLVLPALLRIFMHRARATQE